MTMLSTQQTMYVFLCMIKLILPAGKEHKQRNKINPICFAVSPNPDEWFSNPRSAVSQNRLT